VLELVAAAWERHPHSRLCQLLSNSVRLAGWMDTDVFYATDDRAIEGLSEIAQRAGVKR
jgi:hypothetical protein